MRELKVTPEVWREKMDNLMKRRASVGHNNDNFKVNSVVADYKKHLSKVYVGNTVIDIGCGSCFLKECLPPSVSYYYGIDAFPMLLPTEKIGGVQYYQPIYQGSIEQEETVEYFTTGIKVDTAFAFALMDGLCDFDSAVANIKKIACRNVVFLTGIGIEPDEFHTFRLELSDFRERFTDWKETYCEEISPKVYLLEYTR